MQKALGAARARSSSLFSRLRNWRRPAESQWSKVVLFGDSITQYCFDVEAGCWGALLANKLQRVSDVIARGFSGYNTRWCRLILPQLFDSNNVGQVACFVVFLGANDSCGPASVTGQHVPLEEYRENLVAMVAYLHSIGIERDRIILVTPPVFKSDTWRAHCEATGKTMAVKEEAVVAEYAAACIEAGKSASVEVVDLFSAFADRDNNGELLCDGLHLSKKGAEVLVESLWPKMQKVMFGDSNPDDLWNFPRHEDIDKENPEKSLL